MTTLNTENFDRAGEVPDYVHRATLQLLAGTGTTSYVNGVTYVKSPGAYACITDRAVTPPSPNYSVSCDVKVNSVLAGHSAGVLGRGSASVKQAYYLQIYGDSTLKLQHDGPWGDVASVPFPITAGSTYRVKCVFDDNQISGYVDGVLKIGPLADDTIADAGFPGYVVWADTAGASATTGLVVDNWSFDTLDGGSSLSASAAGAALASGTASASLEGGAGVLNAAAAGAAVSNGSATATMTGTGTITVLAITEWETGNLQPGLSGITVWVNDEETGELVAKLTNQTSHATTADCSISHAAFVPGHDYSVRTRLASGAQYTWTYTAT